MWFVFSSHLASFRKKSIVETLVACFGFVLSSQLASLHKEEYGSGGHHLLWTCFQLSSCQPSQEEHGRDFVHLERFQLSSSQPSQEHGRDCHRLLCICGSSSTLIYPSPRRSRPKATVTMARWMAEAHRRSDPCLIASYKEPQVSNVFPFFTLRTA